MELHASEGQSFLRAGMQMTNANMGGLPMPPAVMMSGQGPRPHGLMGGPQQMQGPPMQQGMPRGPPPRPMHQVRAVTMSLSCTFVEVWKHSQEVLNIHSTSPSCMCTVLC